MSYFSQFPLMAYDVKGDKSYKLLPDKENTYEMAERFGLTIPEIRKEIREFVDTFLLAIDSKALRRHLRDTQPDVDLRYIDEDGKEVAIPIGISFFWPESEL